MKSRHHAAPLLCRGRRNETSGELPKMVDRVMLHPPENRKGGVGFDRQTKAIAARTFAPSAA